MCGGTEQKTVCVGERESPAVSSVEGVDYDFSHMSLP